MGWVSWDDALRVDAWGRMHVFDDVFQRLIGVRTYLPTRLPTYLYLPTYLSKKRRDGWMDGWMDG